MKDMVPGKWVKAVKRHASGKRFQNPQLRFVIKGEYR